ncbi:hypothetical protein CPB83DRAFT_864682 [Crepidotus variabilis]|uniref:A-kinase anchor protein 7-like phosphoesterase domain-containing protein n=1 Tax=Crepidotus variabilis TaxID=179855 RepID=A0A9P6E4A0_9AGAR|nr:hypothetical protein CPB83DRAFT_864682 [Crepidotus variabilis]
MSNRVLPKGSNALIDSGRLGESATDDIQPDPQPRKLHSRRQKGHVEHSTNAKSPNARSHRHQPQKPRPTHFLALPLHNHLELRSRVAAFQEVLFGTETPVSDNIQSNGHASDQKSKIRHSSIVDGLDSSIVIDPVRMHMTLGVIALEPEGVDVPAGTTREESSLEKIPHSKKTVSTALALLNSLKPRIRQILDDHLVVKVPLEVLDILKAERLRHKPEASNGEDREQEGTQENKIGAGVLFLGPRTSLGSQESDEERIKLFAVCDLVHKAFKQAGYLTDTRPLKLHCTILNASHRRPRRWCPFSYSDIRSSKACDLISDTSPLPEVPLSVAKGDQQAAPPTNTAAKARENPEQTVRRAPLVLPPPLPVNLGVWDVGEIQLWIMGSRDGEGRYISCGGVELV